MEYLSFPHSCLITGFVTRLTRHVPLMEQELLTLSEHLNSPPIFKWGSCYSIFSFMCMSCRSLFFLLSFFFWPLWCLSFDLRILITPFVSSTSSNYVHDGYHYSCVWISLSLFPLSRYLLVIRLKKIYNVFMHFSSYCIYIMFS